MQRIKYGEAERYKGEKMPPNTKKVDRSTKYGNPFKLEEFSREDSLKLYSIYLDFVLRKKILDIEPLRGHNLACGCSLDEPCHVDILLERF
jgi:hypothetical protein